MQDKKSIDDYQKVGNEIFDKLHLQTYPIGIKYIKNIEEIPTNAIQPSKRGKMMSICQAFYMSRKFGNIYAITSADNFCTPSTVAHGWVDISEEEFIESQVRQGWHKDEQAERRRAKKLYSSNFKTLIQMGHCGLISFPLHKTPEIPDTILIFGSGAQLTHIIHALNFEHKDKFAIRSSFEGFGESCGKGGLRPFLTQKTQIVIPGSGDRAFAGIQDYEIGIGIPAEHIFYVMKNLFKTGGTQGLGFPIRSRIPLNLNTNLTPGFRYMKDIIDRKYEESKGKPFKDD